MSMYKILSVTNRHLCKTDFLKQIEKICILNKKIQTHSKMCKNLNFLKDIISISIVLREKDLSERNYKILASKVLKICEEYNTECILHSYYNTAEELGVKKIHLPLKTLQDTPEIIHKFDSVGVSIHSIEDAAIAHDLSASYITAGHIFDTDCKKGIPGRGLSFLRNVVKYIDMPVFAIGGISPLNIKQVIECGASGVCIMSGLMAIDNPEDFFNICSSN